MENTPILLCACPGLEFRVWYPATQGVQPGMTALFIGFLMGFFGSVPVAGPISVLVLGRGLAGKTRNGIAIALGGAIPEAFYGALAFLGAGYFLTEHPLIEILSKAVGGVILLVLGYSFFFKPHDRPMKEVPKNDSAPGDGVKRDFATGFMITLINPTIILTWTAGTTVVFGAHFLRHSTLNNVLFAMGALAGIVSWFSILLRIVKKSSSSLNPGIIRWLLRSMGVLLWVFAGCFLASCLKALI